MKTNKKRTRVVVLLSVLVFFGLCAAVFLPGIIRDQAVPVATTEVMLAVTSTPSPTETTLATSTVTATMVPTPEPSPTPTATPEGRTEVGGYLQDLAKDIGFTAVISDPQKADIPEPVNVLFYSVSDGERTYITSYMKGYEVDDQAKAFLLISNGSLTSGPSSEWRLYGLGFSLYYGEVAPECQGTDQMGSFELRHCMRSIEAEFGQLTQPDEEGLTWMPYVVYPLNDEQLSVLINKYSLTAYPEQNKVLGTEWANRK